MTTKRSARSALLNRRQLLAGIGGAGLLPSPDTLAQGTSEAGKAPAETQSRLLAAAPAKARLRPTPPVETE
ncbi:hypothetical protein ACIPIA_06830, partial [Bosea sp. CER48]